MNAQAADHLYFIAALTVLYLLRDWRQVLVLITAFTIGHAVTLALSTLDLITINTGLVEFLIPCTIVLTAASNLFQKKFTLRSIRINYWLALFFGLIHGLAFAGTLRMILASDQNFALSLISFSLGLECGQALLVLLVLLLGQMAVVLLKLNRRIWVGGVSVVLLLLAVKMAVERWPSGRKDISEIRPEHSFQFSKYSHQFSFLAILNKHT
jgi:hypothetical protein